MAENVLLDGNILVVESPAEGVYFHLVWAVAGKQHVLRHIARHGLHAYETRHHPAWTGTAERVALAGLPGATASLAPPTWREERDLFLAPEQITQVTINALAGHTLRGYRLHLLLLGLAAAAATIVLLRRRGPARPPAAGVFLAAVVVASCLYDLRTVYDHGYNVAAHPRNRTLQAWTRTRAWLERLRDDVGDGSWARDETLGWPLRAHADYVLAATPRKPADEATIILRRQDGRVVVERRD